jgi:hypothetical protein
VRYGAVRVAYDLQQIRNEQTVRGEFVRNVLASGLASDEQQQVLITGLRALDGHRDLEVF